MREFAPWGARFWNRRGAKEYREHLQSNQNDLFAHWPPAQIERLSAAEALTDFCHTSLRMMRGLDVGTMRLKFGNQRASLAVARLQALVESEHLATTALGFRLTPKGEVVANLVFEKLTFLAGDVAN
jgi:oxygen-independent coproporphyrinogen-3 oxidase